MCASSSASIDARRSRPARRVVLGDEPRARRRGELVGEHARRPRVGKRRGLERRDERDVVGAQRADRHAHAGSPPDTPRRGRAPRRVAGASALVLLGVGEARVDRQHVAGVARAVLVARRAARAQRAEQPVRARAATAPRRRASAFSPSASEKTRAYLRRPLPASRSGSAERGPLGGDVGRLGDAVGREALRPGRRRTGRAPGRPRRASRRRRPPSSRVARARSAHAIASSVPTPHSGHAEPVREPLRGRHADAHAGERARARARRSRRRRPRSSRPLRRQQRLGHRQQPRHRRARRVDDRRAEHLERARRRAARRRPW